MCGKTCLPQEGAILPNTNMLKPLLVIAEYLFYFGATGLGIAMVFNFVHLSPKQSLGAFVLFVAIHLLIQEVKGSVLNPAN